jgi:hypoxanthine-DNA glycosylase
MNESHVTHTFEPVYNKDSKILVLGSFPSVKSREIQFYYGHPQNRFWRMLAEIFKEPIAQTKEEKKALILQHHLALWDVIASCDIEGSSDSSIRNVEANDLYRILQQADITKILLNGGKAFELYQKYCKSERMPKAIKMPSTSPANAACKIERLTSVWGNELHEL